MRHSWIRRTWDHKTGPIWTCLAHLWHLLPWSYLPYPLSSQATLRRHKVRLSLPQQQIFQLQARRLALHTRRQGRTWPAQRHAHPQPRLTKNRNRCPLPLILLGLDIILNTGEDFLSDLHRIWLVKEIKEKEDVPLLLINSVLLILSSITFV